MDSNNCIRTCFLKDAKGFTRLNCILYLFRMFFLLVNIGLNIFVFLYRHFFNINSQDTRLTMNYLHLICDIFRFKNYYVYLDGLLWTIYGLLIVNALFCAVKYLNYCTAINPAVMDCNTNIVYVEELLICTAQGPHSQGILLFMKYRIYKEILHLSLVC